MNSLVVYALALVKTFSFAEPKVMVKTTFLMFLKTYVYRTGGKYCLEFLKIYPQGGW